MITDLRFIIGVFFIFCGCTLIATWGFGPSDVVEGIHMNLFSGVVMLAFGMLMTGLAYFHKS